MYRYLLIICLMGFLTGCSSNQTFKEAWKFTQRQYRSYLNTPASIDYDATGKGEEYMLALGGAVREVDNELNTLIRIMENTGREIDGEWLFNTMRRLPWLSGIALVDGSGQLITHYPDYVAATFDVTPLLQDDPKQRISMLRAFAVVQEGNTEVYVGNPIYVGPELRGFVVAHFDPRTLIMKSPHPEGFSIYCPYGTLWAGSGGGLAGSINWEAVTKEESRGVTNHVYWVSRYIGNMPIIYAIPTGTASAKPIETPQSSTDGEVSVAPAGQSHQDATDPAGQVETLED